MIKTSYQKTRWTEKLPSIVHELCQSIAQKSGKAWLVGGSVRDLCLQQCINDFDLEVYGLNAKKLIEIAQKFGHTEQLGKHFGVIKLWTHGYEIDLALPRIEKKIATGHRGFDVHSDPQLSTKTASKRRDFTINAMMFDPLTLELLDFHQGQQDLTKGVLRHVSLAFSEDPLRVLRAMQFAARFKFTLAPETATLCHALLPEIAKLPASRVWCEWQKWAHAPYPSFGLTALKDSGCLPGLYPALQALTTCPQDSRWHPEGNVWLHTLQVCDQAALISKRQGLDSESCEHLIFAALCHDLGKPATTFTDANGNIRSPNHSAAGLKPSRAFLAHISAPKRVAQYIQPLVHDHITHLCGAPSSRAVRRLAQRLEPASIALWEMLVEADASGRRPAPAGRPALNWLEKAKSQGNQCKKTPAIVHGRMLLDMGMTSGASMGVCIRAAYQAQLDGEFHDIASAKAWLNIYLETLSNTIQK
ncbi:MAG: tRNA nucleotidyltransferase [Mariprofundaceae bacterium]|nr:tRNA nucleotidyltransferase [Mariprofundaceae bacterium]